VRDLNSRRLLRLDFQNPCFKPTQPTIQTSYFIVNNTSPKFLLNILLRAELFFIINPKFPLLLTVNISLFFINVLNLVEEIIFKFEAFSELDK
tara:strand:- start:705 stop:983 length:279 start_codon:yes stop_codon:yes gene_type:complete